MSAIKEEESRMNFRNIKGYFSSASYVGSALMGLNSWVKSFYVSEAKDKEAANHIVEMNKELVEVKGEMKKIEIISHTIAEINKELLLVKMRVRKLNKYFRILLAADLVLGATAILMYINNIG